MAICWINYTNAQAIFTYANHEQEMAETEFRLDVSADESEVISKLIKSYFDMDNAEDREMISDIVKVSFCFSDTEYYFDEEQRDDVETSIKELLDCWKEEIV